MKNILTYTVLALFIGFMACEEKEENPEIKTANIKALSASRYYVKAEITDKGNIPITDHGFIYYIGNSDYSQVVGVENKVSLGEKVSADTFSTVIEIENTGYYSGDIKIYARAYLTNEKGTLYAQPLSSDILRLQVTDILPNHSKTGDTVTIKGSNFDVIASNNVVTFNNITAIVVGATPTKLKVVVPAISVNYYDSYVTVRVRSGNQTIELSNFSLDASPSGFSPNHGSWSNSITIYGSGLGYTTVYFDNIAVSAYNSSGNNISVSIPSDLPYKTFKLYIEKNGQKTEVPGGSFTMDKIQVNSFSPQKCLQGSTVSIYGSNFNPSYNKNKLYIGNQIISSDYSYSYLQFIIPSSLAKGTYNAYVSNGLDSVFLPGQIEVVKPEITSITPSSGYPNTKFTITGKNLLNSSNTYVYFDNYSVWCSSPDSETIKGNIPSIEPGTYSVYANVGNLQVKSPVDFTVLAPTLTSVTPSSGAANTSVIINGEGFGTNASNIYVYFGSLQAFPMTLSNTQINVKVPSGVTSGTWMVSVNVNNYTIPTTLTFTVP